VIRSSHNAKIAHVKPHKPHIAKTRLLGYISVIGSMTVYAACQNLQTSPEKQKINTVTGITNLWTEERFYAAAGTKQKSISSIIPSLLLYVIASKKQSKSFSPQYRGWLVMPPCLSSLN